MDEDVRGAVRVLALGQQVGSEGLEGHVSAVGARLVAGSELVYSSRDAIYVFSGSEHMDAAVVAAIITAGVTFLAFLADRYREAVGRKRGVAADALSDALLWLEVPYRIRRRADNSPATLSNLAERMHQLQEKHIFHASWLRVEIPAAHSAYVALLGTVKEQVAPHIQAAWNSTPAERPDLMNVGRLFEADVAKETDAYAEAVVGSLRLFPWRVRRLNV